MKTRLLRPVRVAGVTLALAAIGAPAAQAQAERFIPGYSDFPNALRIEGGSAVGRFTPGHSDFPNHLRVASVYDRARANGGAAEDVVVIAAPNVGGFDWTDAGIGAGGAAGVLLLAAGVAALTVRRPVRRAALTG